MMLLSQDFITPHITDSHALDYPCLKAGFICEVGLPHWTPFQLGNFTIDMSPTKHVVMLLIAATLCLIAIMFADLTFAVDSIPAALGISHDRVLLLTSNLLALLGLRALFQIVSIARERLRYMDQTIAVLLAIIGLKLLLGGVLHIGPLASLVAVLVVLAGGTLISLRSGRPDAGAIPPNAP